MAFAVRRKIGDRIAVLSPLVARRDVMGRATALFYVVIGSAAVALGLAMPSPRSNSLVIAGVGAALVLIGVLVYMSRDRIGDGGHFVLVVSATAALTFLIGQSPSATGDVAMAGLYSCIACHVALIFPLARAALLTTVAVLCCFVVSYLDTDMPWWSTIPPATAAALVGASAIFVAEIAREAVIDPLTGLLNRRGFEHALQGEIARAATSGKVIALVLFDLDRFETVNDHLGRARGDALLREVSQRWLEELDRDCLLARYGGDEFALLLPRTSEADAVETADRLRAVAPQECSAGVTTWRRGDTAALFFGRADIALYRAKRDGRDCTNVERAERPNLVEDVRHAIAAGALDVYLQPIVRLSTEEETVAYEALVRWPDSPDPRITPEEIVRVAEDNGIIAELGRFVLERACERTLRVPTTGTSLTLNVNVSGLELLEPDYSDTVLAILHRLKWPARLLVLEVTERDLAAESRVARNQLQQLRRAGIRIAIDDFGSGYSSLTRVATLPCDILKVDGAVVADTSTASPLLDAVTAMAKAFDLEVIVEGIETREQADLLGRHGIDLAQGYLYGHPEPLNRRTEI